MQMSRIIKQYFHLRSQGHRPVDAWFYATHYEINEFGIGLSSVNKWMR